jgi:hypothetical protein
VLRPSALAYMVLQRARADRAVVAVAWLLVLCAVTLTAASTLYGDAVAAGGLQAAVRAAPPAASSIVVSASVSEGDVAILDEPVRARVTDALGVVGGTTVLTVRSTTFVVGEGTDRGAAIATMESLAERATLLEGAWAAPGAVPAEATLSAGAASALGVTIGDRVLLRDSLRAERTIEVVIVGTWQPDGADPSWLGRPLELDGTEARGTFTEIGPLVVADGELARLGVDRVSAEWRVAPNIAAMGLGTSPELASALTALRSQLRTDLRAVTELTTTTDLPTLLASATEAGRIGRSSISLLIVQFGALAIYAVLLVAGMIVERRRPEVALLRSRGATTSQAVILSALEGMLIALPAVLLAPILALGVVRLIGALEPLGDAGILASAGLDATVMVASVLGGLSCVALFTIPTLAASPGLAGVRAAIGRASTRTAAQRFGFDLVLVVLAAIGLWQLRTYGSAITRSEAGEVGVDPLLMLAPTAGLLAGAVLAIRVVPGLAALAERLVRGRRDLGPGLGARQVARRPLRYTRSAFLLLLASALGTLAVTHAATWSGSQADQAGHQVGADARVRMTPFGEVPPWAAGEAVRSAVGADAAMAVDREAFQLGRAVRDGVILGISPPSGADPIAAGSRLDPIVGDTLAAVATTSDVPTIPLPGEPVELHVTLDVGLDIRQEFVGAPPLGPDDPLPPRSPNATDRVLVRAIIEDGSGRWYRVSGGSAQTVGLGQVVAVPLTVTVEGQTLRPTYPVSLVAIEVQPVLGFGVAAGWLDVTGLATERVTIDGSPATNEGWTWTKGGHHAGPASEPVIVAEADGFFGTSNPLAVVTMTAQPLGTMPATPVATLPAVVSEALMAQAGARVGDELRLVMDGTTSLPIRIVAAVGRYPTLDPDQPFALVDGAALQRARTTLTNATPAAAEWWLVGADPSLAERAGALTAPPYQAQSVVVRAALADDLAQDPVALGIVGALVLGSLAALAFAAIGFVFTATVSADERAAEFALLRALGLSPRQLSWWLTLEHAALMAFGILAGTAIGLLLAPLVLPFAGFTTTGAPAVPEPTIVVPWGALAPLYLTAVVLVASVAITVARRLPRTSLTDTLRRREGAA